MNNIAGLYKLNFKDVVKNKKINTVSIPCFYSLVDRRKEESASYNEYLQFWYDFEKLFVRKHLSRYQLYTAPITIFSSIYE